MSDFTPPVPPTPAQLEFDGGRVARDHWRDDPLEIDAYGPDDLGRLMESEDPTDRCRAYLLAERLHQAVTLPDGTWTVYSTYKDGRGGRGRRTVWSAHYTEDEAKRWAEATDAHWQAKDAWRGGTNYLTTYGQLDGIAPHYLRYVDAEPRFYS